MVLKHSPPRHLQKKGDSWCRHCHRKPWMSVALTICRVVCHGRHPPEGWLSGKRKKRRLWTLSCVHERERNADIIFIDFDSWVTQLQRTTALQHYNNTKRPECFDGVTKWVQPTQTNTNTYFKTNSTIKGSINWGVLMRNNSVGNANENVHVVGSELINLWGSLDLVWRMQSCIGANIMQECCETAWARKQSLLQLMNKSLFR